MNNEESKKDHWVRVASKSRAGRFYLFNKATGETQWLPLKENDEAKDKEQDSPLKLSLEKIVKTPAQDRLKRLQHSLKLSQTKPRTSNTKQKSFKEQENEFDAGPSTSSSSKAVAKSPKKAIKRSHASSFPSEGDDLVKCSKPSVAESFKKLPLPDSSSDKCENTANGSSAVDACNEDSHSTKQLVNKNLQNVGTSSSKLSNIRSGIVKKIKEICKLPYNMTKRITDENLHSKTDNPLGVANTSKFKSNNKAKPKQFLSKSATQETIIKQLNEESSKSPEKQIFTCSLSTGTPKNLNIPSCPRGSANLRLERLKQSLVAQQQSSNAKYSSGASIVIETNNNTTSKDYQINSNESTNTADKSRSDDVEAMDWQPITKEENKSEATTFKSTLVVEKSRKLSLKAAKDDDNLTMGDIIDTVNENLLRFSAERQKDSIKSYKKWRKDFYYFVVDTNVLLNDLTFIEDLTKMKLCDTKGSVLYIPYSVLQELDKLKMRSGTQEGLKTLAVRAIKYLNTKLESNSLHIQAQSAVEERQHLININSADDSIINCCLQVKNHIPNLLFLTEDVNLRNKAISNNIIVSTKSNLIAKRYDSSDIS